MRTKMSLVSFFLVAMTPYGVWTHHDTIIQTKEFDAKGLEMINVRAGAGHIKVQGGDVQKVKVTITGSMQRCSFVTEIQGNQLYLEAKNPSHLSWKNKGCEAGFQVEAPGNLLLQAKAGSGDIDVVLRKADVDLSAGSGDIRLKQVQGNLVAGAGSGDVEGEISSADVNVKVGSGEVNLTGLTGVATIKAGSGDIKLQWAHAPGAGQVDIRAGSGDTILIFPENTKLVSDVDTGSGHFLNELGDVPGASLRVLAQSGSGDVSIRKALLKTGSSGQ